ncbi:class I SAM-dependent methyltransferase [Kineococcus sp. GCM10028916]|uniref:class I SAM-dependent methyltransferase n=1 Tax=Kineococcus sp. GCM10028916 TaxID=3273394 RepID=UPI00363CF15B
MDHHAPHRTGHGHEHEHGEQESVLDLDAEVFGAQLGEALDLVPVTTPRRVVDLGAGTGTGTRLLRSRFPDAHLTAVDNSPAMAERLRQQGFDVHEADLDAGFPPLGPVDLVWASSSLHHVADPAALLAGVRTALAPGGVFVVLELDGLPRFLTASEPEDRAHAAAAAAGWNHYPEWQSVLEAAGFSVTRTSLTTTAPDGPTARRYARLWFDRFAQAFGIDLPEVPDGFAPRVTRTVWVAEVAR